MEGLEITELKLSELMLDNGVLRIDPEYFGKSVLNGIRQLKKCNPMPIEVMANVTDGIHESIPYIDDGVVKILSAKHPKDNYIEDSRFEFVSTEYHQKNPRTALCKDDILLSTVGTIGNTAVVDSELLPANSDRHIGIIRIRDTKTSPYFVSSFLTSRYGRMQSLRESTGNVQLNLFISKINTILVPRFSESFEEDIACIAKNAYKLRKISKKVFKKAELILLKTLGLENWQPTPVLSYERKSSEVFAAGRLDAEHFQARFSDLENKIAEKHTLKHLSEFLIVNQRGSQPIYSDLEEGLPVINSKHVREGEVLLFDNRLAILPDKETALIIRKGDVLINGTGVGTIGRSAPYLHEQDALPDNHITILRSNTLNPIFFYLSKLCRWEIPNRKIYQRFIGTG